MATNERTIRASSAPAERVLMWLGWADKDYLASRRMLLKGYLPQGAALANTALEKYFKTLLILVGSTIPRSHNVFALYNLLRPQFPNLGEIDTTFLQLLVKAYRLRYPDDLEIDFSLPLIQPMLLTELDRTVHIIRRGFGFNRQSSQPVDTRLDSMLKDNDPDLVEYNCYFSNVPRTDVFEALTRCYEMRVVTTDRVLEASYQANIPDSREFSLEGLRPSVPDDVPKQEP